MLLKQRKAHYEKKAFLTYICSDTRWLQRKMVVVMLQEKFCSNRGKVKISFVNGGHINLLPLGYQQPIGLNP